MRHATPWFPSHAAAAGAAVALLVAGPAAAEPITGTFGAGGYDIVTFAVDAPSRVDLRFTGGYADPGFALFDAAGAHLISNDDANGSLWSHLTQDLGTGTYRLMVTYCCDWLNAVNSSGASYAYGDGYNSGSYWTGGSATLAGVSSWLDARWASGGGAYSGWGGVAGASYALSMDAARVVTTDLAVAAVPEPATLALVGVALLGAAAVRRRRVRG